MSVTDKQLEQSTKSSEIINLMQASMEATARSTTLHFPSLDFKFPGTSEYKEFQQHRNGRAVMGPEPLIETLFKDFHMLHEYIGRAIILDILQTVRSHLMDCWDEAYGTLTAFQKALNEEDLEHAIGALREISDSLKWFASDGLRQSLKEKFNEEPGQSDKKFFNALEVSMEAVFEEVATNCRRKVFLWRTNLTDPKNVTSRESRDLASLPNLHGYDRKTNRDLFDHNEGFTWIKWNRREYEFAKGHQANTVRHLWQAWMDGKKGVSREELAEIAECEHDSSFQLASVFRVRCKRSKQLVPHDAWKTVIVSIGKGVYALDDNFGL